MVRDENKAAKNWSRMVRRGKGRDYLEQRELEIQRAVKEKIVYDTQQTVEDLPRFQSRAEGRGDFTNAIKAAVEALKVQGKYVTHSETVRNCQCPGHDGGPNAGKGVGRGAYLIRQADLFPVA